MQCNAILEIPFAGGESAKSGSSVADSDGTRGFGGEQSRGLSFRWRGWQYSAQFGKAKPALVRLEGALVAVGPCIEHGLYVSDLLRHLVRLLLGGKVEHDKRLFTALGDLDELEHLFILLLQQPKLSASKQGRTLLSNSDRLAVKVEHRLGVVLLRLDVDGGVVVVGSHPRLGGRRLAESSVGRRRPLHWSTGVVTARLVDVLNRLLQRSLVAVGALLDRSKVVDAVDVEVLLGTPGGGNIGHADLFALVDVDGAGERHVHERQQLARVGDVLGLVRRKARDGARLVVVLDKDGGPSIVALGEALPLVDDALHVRQTKLDELEEVDGVAAEVDQVELEHLAQLVLGRRDVAHHVGGLGRVGELADGHRVVLFEDGAHLLEVGVHHGTVAVEHAGGLGLCALVDDGRVGEVHGLGVHVDGVDAESVDALFEPELHGALVDGVAAVVVGPVEVGLFGAEEVEVVLLRLLVPGPSGLVEVGPPVVGRPAGAVGVVLCRPPDVPVALAALLGRARVFEPGMLVRGVVYDEVEDELDAARVTLGDELVHVSDGAVGRVDGLVVRDVVAHVDLRRVVHGREPDGVDAERLDVVERLDDALDVAHAVVVAVAEGGGPDLVYDGIAEPEGARARADERVVGGHFAGCSGGIAGGKLLACGELGKERRSEGRF
ncbi:hypothetical protein L1887_51321 [Cichorium endivia]|nr:hypothetical protein L1887_51321 [Cichorium endivia]